MSAIGKVMYQMKCDHPDGCSAELESDYDGASLYGTADEAREAARGYYDWVYVDGKDFCFDHAPHDESGDPL